MISDLQRRKLSQLFRMCDLTSDGFLEQADFEQAAANICKTFSVDADSAAYIQLHAMYAGQWQQLQQYADPNGNGRVDMDEWMNYWTGMLSSSEALQMLVDGYYEGFHAMWNLVDPDGPAGFVTPERWSKYFVACNRTAAEGMAALYPIDRDGDGRADRAEMIGAVMEFFGDSPDAAGNGLYGAY